MGIWRKIILGTEKLKFKSQGRSERIQKTARRGKNSTDKIRDTTWRCLFKDIVDHFKKFNFCTELYEKLLKYLSRVITWSDVCFIRNFPISMLTIDWKRQGRSKETRWAGVAVILCENMVNQTSMVPIEMKRSSLGFGIFRVWSQQDILISHYSIWNESKITQRVYLFIYLFIYCLSKWSNELSFTAWGR